MCDSDASSAIHRGAVWVTELPSTLLRRATRADDLLRDGGTMAAATVLAGALNYAYQVVVGRALGPEEYGVFGALTSLFYILNVVGRGVRFSTARFASEFRDDGGRLAVFHRGALVRTLAVATAVCLLLAATTPEVAGFLDVASPWPVVLVAGTVPFSLALSVNFGFFQGVESFVRFGGYKVLQAGLTLGFAAALLALGVGLLGAFVALFAATAVAFVASTAHARTGAGEATPRSTVDYGRAYRYALPAVLAGFCLTVPTSVDVVLAKHFFTDHRAGLYTAVSVLGKVLVFLPLGISMALFPKVSAAGSDGAQRRLFRRAFLYTAVLGGAGTLCYWVAPSAVLGAVYTAEYAAGAAVLQWYGLAILAYSLALVALNFELARDRLRYVYLFAALSVAEIALLWRYHGSMLTYARILLGVNAVLLVAGLVEVRR